MSELPPLPRFEVGTILGPADIADVYDSVEARERILLARIAELEADAGRYRVALVDCMKWMESGRASTDWGFWDWKEGDVYMRAKAAIYAARKA